MGSEKGPNPGARFDEETRLMLRAVAGDDIAFIRLYEKYLPAIMAHLASLSICCTSVEELTQEIFVRLWQNRAQFGARSAVRDYIYGILRNVLSDHKKHLSKHISAKNHRFSDGFSVRRDGLSEPESEVCRVEVEEAVEQAMSKLTTEQNQAVRLFYFEQITPSNSKAMANRANCSAEAFRSRLRRAHSELHQFLNNVKP
jgi:RNA polymerase sigma-70 factor (ECF subfamily)